MADFVVKPTQLKSVNQPGNIGLILIVLLLIVYDHGPSFIKISIQIDKEMFLKIL